MHRGGDAAGVGINTESNGLLGTTEFHTMLPAINNPGNCFFPRAHLDLLQTRSKLSRGLAEQHPNGDNTIPQLR